MFKIKIVTSFFLCVLFAEISVAQVTFTVNTNQDGALSGDSDPGNGICDDIRAGTRCTLRAAIEEANAGATAKVIKFAVSFTIKPNTPLPTVTGIVIFDGRDTPGYNSAATDIGDAPPRIYLDGSNLAGTPSADGLSFRRHTSVYAIGIINFPDKGIDINAPSGASSRIDSNWIGVDASGAAAGNGTGIQVSGKAVSIGERQGANDIPLGNVVSSNSGIGISILGGEDITVVRNRVGVSADGSARRPNGGGGVRLVGTGNIIGGVGTGNDISFNIGAGIELLSGNNTLRGNLIDSNTSYGVRVNGTNNQIGGNADEHANRILANGSHGILLGDLTGASSSDVRNNTISSNGGRGIWLRNGSLSEIRSNVIFSNNGDGIRVDANDVTVTQNTIGYINDDSPVIVSNIGNGIVVNASHMMVSNNSIGGSTSSNHEGIDVWSGDANQVFDNNIGVTATFKNIPNVGTGIRVDAAATSILIAGNVVGNSFHGITLEASNARICGNYVGVRKDFTDIGNVSEGIHILGDDNLVGQGCLGNYFGFNGSDGIEAVGNSNHINGNFLGGSTTQSFPNGAGGILFVFGASNNQVDDNLIVNNHTGVRVAGSAGVGNDLRANLIYANTSGVGIDLNDDGISINDANDADTGPNRRINTLEIVSHVSQFDRVLLDFKIDAATANVDYPIQVDFYRTESFTNEPQGQFYINTVIYDQAPGSTKSVEVLAPPNPAYRITAIITDDSGNTSEFSPPFQPGQPVSGDIFKDSFEGPIFKGSFEGP